MKSYRLQRIQFLPVTLGQAWRFFSSPLNLPLITPDWLNLSIIGKVADQMFDGMVIRYRLTPLLGIPVRWVSEITHVDPPHCFVDQQRSGPYRYWHHRHRFRPAAGGVEMSDTVSYGLKFGFIGSLAHELSVHRKLDEIFDYRQKMLQQLFPV